MALLPLLPLFHRLNREHFAGTLAVGTTPLMAVRWSNGRLRKTAGFYSRGPNVLSPQGREIVLSRPILEPLAQKAIESTLCHEMIHAWTDIILGIEEGHGPNFRARMKAINQSQESFKVSIRHNFPVPKSKLKWLAICPNCGLESSYHKRVKKIACRSCCERYQGGKWDPRFVLTFFPNEEES